MVQARPLSRALGRRCDGERSGWAASLRRTRHIADFRNWKDHDAFKKAWVAPTSLFDVGATRLLSSRGYGIRSMASMDASSR